MKSAETLRLERLHRVEVGLILGQLMPHAERLVIAAHRSGKKRYHGPALAALRLLRLVERDIREDER